VSARVDLFLHYFSPFPRSIMVEQDATQLRLKYYCALLQAKLLLESEAPLFIPCSLSLPVNQAGSAFRSLSPDLLNILRSRFIDLKVMKNLCLV